MAADPTEEPATEVPIPPDLAPATAPRGSVPASLAPQDNVLGGILLILGGLELFGSSQLDFGRLHIHLGIEGLQALVIPLLLVALGALVIATPAHRMLYGVVALAVAVYSIVGVNLGGFLVGFLLAAVGGILTVSWMPRPEVREGAVDAEGAGGGAAR